MPIVHMASNYQDAVKRCEETGGKNLKLYHARDHSQHTICRWSSDGDIYLNLNPGIPVNEQPRDGYDYSPIDWSFETHHGVCLFESEYNGYHDSDFYMTVWNVATGKPEKLEFATTRAGCGAAWGSHVDATPEVKAAYEAYTAELRRQQDAARIEYQRRVPEKGKVIKVVKGRKVAKGTTGVCIWRGRSDYGERVGLKTESGEVFWTALSNVEVVL